MSGRREQKDALRAERLAKQQAAAAAARRKKLAGYAAAAVLGVAAIVAIVIALAAGGGDDGPEGGQPASPGIEVSYPDDPPAIAPQQETDLAAAAKAAGCKLADPENEGASHVEDAVAYRANPPTSGNHFPVPAEDGAYTQAPQTERSVHTLEHGRIWIQFKPTLPQPQIDKLFAIFAEDPYHMVIAPNGTEMKPLVAATAWDHSITCDRWDDKVIDAIRSFRETYRDQGPEQVP
ncbi:MAG TPA: DUF3105 domain-containing protein [Thermoleophilaceae bacterium]|nr:DUF3105 domain-containing protein [Thermoleophilaceae bacterium]